MGKMKGNWEMERLANPTVSTTKPVYASLYVPKSGQLKLFKRRVKIVRKGWGHTYWNYKGKDICPVIKRGDHWIISTKAA